MKKKLEQFVIRLKELELELGKPDAIQDQKVYRKLSQEHAYLTQITQIHANIERIEKDLMDNHSMLKQESEEEMIQMIEETIEKDQKSKLI